MIKRQEVYDLYWYFACERQNIFWKKINGEPAPWTDDKILQEYKFCNSYRVNDRVSQYLLKMLYIMVKNILMKICYLEYCYLNYLIKNQLGNCY